MKKLLTLLFILMLSTLAHAQIGLGVKLGDPTALSAKFYTGGKVAFEVNLGASPYRYGYDYYNRYYKHYWHDKNPNMHYVGGTAYYYGSLCLQARALVHNDIKGLDIDGKLQWYVGAGVQYRQRTFSADYWDNNGYYYNDLRDTDIDLGIDGIIGVEYTFENAPLSIFADVNLFMEVVDQVYPWGQGGIGVRYNFGQ